MTINTTFQQVSDLWWSQKIFRGLFESNLGHCQGQKGAKTLNVDRDNSKTTWNFDMRSKRVDSVNLGLKHIKKCQKGSGPPPYGLN